MCMGICICICMCMARTRRNSMQRLATAHRRRLRNLGSHHARLALVIHEANVACASARQTKKSSEEEHRRVQITQPLSRAPAASLPPAPS
eukprot:5040575-Prymnesium_polylepis.1